MNDKKASQLLPIYIPRLSYLEMFVGMSLLHLSEIMLHIRFANQFQNNLKKQFQNCNVIFAHQRFWD